MEVQAQSNNQHNIPGLKDSGNEQRLKDKQTNPNNTVTWCQKTKCYVVIMALYPSAHDLHMCEQARVSYRESVPQVKLKPLVFKSGSLCSYTFSHLLPSL